MSNHEAIQERLRYAAAIADLIVVAESAHLCKDTMADAAELTRTLVQEARELAQAEHAERRAQA